MDNRHQQIAGSAVIKEANDRSDFFCKVRIHSFVRLREASKLDTQTVLAISPLQTLASRIGIVCPNCREHRHLCCACAFDEQAIFCQDQAH